MIKKNINSGDVENWYYSDEIRKHFFKPKNFIMQDPAEKEFDAFGEVGSLACGDIMKMWIKVEPKTKKIKKLKWRTWGCATAIASTSVFSEMVMEKGGKTIAEALNITPKQITERLQGIPARKFHCSVLADKAFKAAAADYLDKIRKK